MIDFTETDNKTVATIVDTNRVTSANATEIKAAISAKIANTKSDFTFDLSNVKFIDSTGISVIISALKQCREKNIAFSLKGVGTEVMSLLTLMKLDKIIDFE